MKTSRFFPYLLMISVIAAAMEIDLSLPSFPDIARAFSVSESMVERTISLNFLGFAISALFYGPLADRFGRRPIMLLGNALFLIGSIGCALASSIESILLFRFIQGLGAAASFVIVFTMISDVYQGNEATAWIGRIHSILTAVVALAPILGAYLNAHFGWQACYSTIAISTAITFTLMLFLLPETRPGRPVQFKEVVKDYSSMLRSTKFMQCSLVPNLLAGGYFAFISIIPFLYRDELRMPLSRYSFHQAAIIACFSFMSHYASRIASAFGEKRSALIGLIFSSLATSILLILSVFTRIPPIWLITPLMCIFSGTCAVVFAIVFSTSLAIFPDKNGPATSLLMSMRTLLCAGMVQVVGWLYNGTVLPIAILLTTSCVLCLILASSYYQKQVATQTA